MILNSQQETFLKNYIDPSSETWSNAVQSALKAGYSEEYANNITALMPKWLEEAINDNKILEKAIKNLSDFIGDSDNKPIQWDATKFALSRLGKSKFSERVEQTGKDGKDLQITLVKYGTDKDSI
jgi:hypothetical protein